MSALTFSAAQQILPGVVDLRRRIHANPELGNQLPDTTAAVVENLADLNLPIRFSETTTSLIASVHGTGSGDASKRILLRGDMDALPMPEDNDLPFASKNPGRMHACGHDSHTAMLAGAARLLDGMKDQFAGTVDLFFQTGEEGYFGAREVLDEGLMDGEHEPDAVFAMHITPLIDAGVFAGRGGPIMAAADEFHMMIRGKGGHASMPQDCIDPIPVACEIVQAFQTFVTRRINAFDPIVLTVAKIEAGTTTNVIPEVAKVSGTLRSTSEASRKKAHDGLAQLATKIGEAHGVTVEFNLEVGYPVTVNDATFVDFAADSIRKSLGDNSYFTMPSPVMGAEDFSYLLQRWPGAMLFLGVKPEDPSLAAPCHSNRMMLNESAMAHGVAVHTQVALDYLSA